jgi:Ca2+-binding RTX toxin-like protein
MALQSYNWSIIGPGVLADLGTTDDVYVGESGFLSSSNERSIRGYGSYHSATIRGEVAGYLGGLSLGNDASSDSHEQVFVAKHGSVTGDTSYALYTLAYDSSVENNGVIRGATGVLMDGDSAFSTSTLMNRGKIVGDTGEGVLRWGSEDFQFTNKGLVSGHSGHGYDGSSSSGDQSITNSGKMVGSVTFGSGDDTYLGAHGKLSGTVYGGDGDDHFVGGAQDEKFEGGVGRDRINGGGGADDFVFVSVADSTLATGGRDLIVGFSQSQHDQIDLSLIDAKASTVLDDHFKFIGTNSFDGHEGQLRYYNAGGHTFIQGDTNGDGTADFAIELDHSLTLHKTDFVL